MRLGGIWKKGLGSTNVDPIALVRIKTWTRDVLALDEDATVAANEIVCADPACPGSETVILVMIPGQRTKAYKLQAAAADVTAEMVSTAIKTL